MDSMDPLARLICSLTVTNPGGSNGGKLEPEFPFSAGRKVSLKHQGIFWRQRAIHPEATPQSVPAICSALTIEVQHMVLVEILCIDAEVRLLTQLSAVLDHSESLLEISSTGFYRCSRRLGCFLGVDADAAGHGVYPPCRPAGPAHS